MHSDVASAAGPPMFRIVSALFPQSFRHFRNISASVTASKLPALFPQSFHSLAGPPMFRIVSAMFPQSFRSISATFPQCYRLEAPRTVSAVFPQSFRTVPAALYISLLSFLDLALASFPGLKTDYSAVVLDRSLARLAFSYVLGLLSLCSAVSLNSVPGALSHSILRFSLRLLRYLRGSLREHDCMCYIDDRPPKLHFENFNIDYPLDLLCCEKYVYFQIFTTRLSLFNEHKIYGTTYEYTYQTCQG